MKLIKSIAELSCLDDFRDKPLVLVPTMGALHQGHLSLVNEASKHGRIIVSIFVNPTQFGPTEDFGSYPRTVEKDLELLSSYNVDAVFVPEVTDMYADGISASIQPGDRASTLCGSGRPGHFAGVLTVVAKLFNMTQADISIFGRKDAQQCLVIDQMVQDLNMPIKLIDAPTLREPGGLAMSSRNRYLSQAEKTDALSIYKSLIKAKQMLIDGVNCTAEIKGEMHQILSPCDEIEYVEILQVPSLKPIDSVINHCLIAVAAKVGSARLIDNLSINIQDNQVTEIPLLGGK